MYKCPGWATIDRVATRDETPARRPRTPRGQGAELREQLIAHATALIDELGGASRLSIRAVTKRAGVSPMALYLHFADRDELVHAVVERGFARFVAALETARDARDDPVERLRAMGRAYIAFAREQPAFYRVIFGRVWPGDTAPQGAPAPSATVAFELLVDAVAACLPAARREGEARLVALGLWSGLHGFVSLATTRPGIAWPDDGLFVDQLGDRWLR
jgi:AcrR family transcriptional regulator